MRNRTEIYIDYFRVYRTVSYAATTHIVFRTSALAFQNKRQEGCRPSSKFYKRLHEQATSI
ncbi:hypothetical protein ALQ90_200292 [Pseudomonas savastanoi pv. savastanoi]|nr:hypothetical protein ALQ90_200292 [Pseudomonas savastanoi pv. savastanoi]RMR67592.1 hypothetical protein ALP81_200029 [Pseudomonas savastanoi pv. fraxini]